MSHYHPPDLSADELLTADEVAHILRVDVTTVRRWVKSGAMKAVLLPMTGIRHIYRFKRADINKLLTVEVPT